jgi:hypothetical protein
MSAEDIGQFRHVVSLLVGKKIEVHRMLPCSSTSTWMDSPSTGDPPTRCFPLSSTALNISATRLTGMGETADTEANLRKSAMRHHCELPENHRGSLLAFEEEPGR